MDGLKGQDGRKPLLISRREHESLLFDEEITVVIVAIRDGTIRLAIEGPPGTHIRRGEESECRVLG